MRRILLIACLFWASRLFAEEKPIDYQTLDFSIHLKALRAGNHDESGMNQYFFQVKLFGLPILKEELKKPLAERQKTERNLGNFAELQIEALKYWMPEKKPGPKFSLAVTGDAMRALIAEVMSQFKVTEDRTAVFCMVSLYEKNKKFGFFGQDTKVADVTYELIPETLPRMPRTENKVLTMQDDKGTFVNLSFEFKNPPTQATSAPAQANGTATAKP